MRHSEISQNQLDHAGRILRNVIWIAGAIINYYFRLLTLVWSKRATVLDRRIRRAILPFWERMLLRVELSFGGGVARTIGYA